MTGRALRRNLTGFALGWIAAAPLRGVQTYEIVVAVIVLAIALIIDHRSPQ